MIFKEVFPTLPEATHLFGRTLISVRELPDLKGIRVYRAGLHLGEIRGKIAVPDHAAAMCFRTTGIPVKDMNADEACSYMAGLTISGDTEGWTLMRWQGLAAGWGKGSGGIIKNHYPKGLRSQNLIP